MTGLCKCGCGEVPPIAKRTRPDLGHVAGQHIDYCRGHKRRVNPGPRWIEQDCGYESPCWVWQDALWNGYGKLQINGKRTMAHRAIYEQHRGPIPAGLDLDHLCRNPPCVNPAHMDPVAHPENVRRGLSAKLSVEAAQDIRRRCAEAKATPTAVGGPRKRVPDGLLAELAAEYGVAEITVRDVWRGRRWVA